MTEATVIEWSDDLDEGRIDVAVVVRTADGGTITSMLGGADPQKFNDDDLGRIVKAALGLFGPIPGKEPWGRGARCGRR